MDNLEKKMTVPSLPSGANRLSCRATGWKPIGMFLGLLLAFAVVSCSSPPSYVRTPGYVIPAEEGKTVPGAPSVPDQGGNKAEKPAGPVLGTDLRKVEGSPAGTRREAAGPPKGSRAHANGDESDIAFTDLPKIEIDERDLGKRTTVGNDALIEKELKRLLKEFGEDKEVGTVFLNEVKLYVKAFQTNEQYRKFVNNSLRRSARYMPAVKEVFKKRNLPEDMAFIAFVESGFNPRARSHAGAVGMWQFIPGTARRYSLKVSSRTDERLDPVKSTYAAVEYFHDLIAIFGPRSFLLALAAYNCGEGRIIGCLKKIDNPLEERNFWHIRSCLARETREYPPKIIAAAVIGSNPEVFGFPRFQMNGEGSEIRTAFASREALEDVTPPSVEPVPPPADEARKPATIQKKKVSKKVAKAPARKSVIYVVKRNNTLSGVADIFRVRPAQIKSWNRMRGNRLMAGQKLKIYPPVAMERVRYKVRRGDTITDICRNFNVRPTSVVQANGLRSGWAIRTGQRLVLYRPAKKKPIIYTVRRGDNLTSIADKFDVSPEDIMRWNKMKRSRIHPKQRLKIYPS